MQEAGGSVLPTGDWRLATGVLGSADKHKRRPEERVGEGARFPAGTDDCRRSGIQQGALQAEQFVAGDDMADAAGTRAQRDQVGRQIEIANDRAGAQRIARAKRERGTKRVERIEARMAGDMQPANRAPGRNQPIALRLSPGPGIAADHARNMPGFGLGVAQWLLALWVVEA